MLNLIPGIGWLLSLFFSICLAVPFWFIWTVFGIGEKYAYWLPAVYLNPGFWDCVGVFIVMGIIHVVFVPKIASAVSTHNADSKKD